MKRVARVVKGFLIGGLAVWWLWGPGFARESAIGLERAYPGVSLPRQVQALHRGGAWTVVMQDGRVMRFEDRAEVSEASEVIRIPVADGGEKGLLGWAFHPRFEDNGFAFADFTRELPEGLSTVIARYHSADGGRTFDLASESIVLKIPQPAANHNGGQLRFGPDGYLYIGMGDGGAANDRFGNGQNKDTLLGAMLRIDVDGGDPYGIPEDNPLAQGGGAPEVYAWGLRNPWRWTFDRQTGELWLGDVGQDAWEELDRVERGGNYGWPMKEGRHCFAAPEPCDDPSWQDPVLDYGHREGRSIVAGYAYRGTALPDLVGDVLYGDFYTGTIWAYRPGGEDSTRALASGTGLNISSFAEDGSGEVYVLDYGGGGLWRIEPLAGH